jgi:hypothetical protein
MKITDLNGKVIEVENLDLALIQSDDYRHFRHANKGFEQIDERLQCYWEDVYQKLVKIKEAGG